MSDALTTHQPPAQPAIPNPNAAVVAEDAAAVNAAMERMHARLAEQQARGTQDDRDAMEDAIARRSYETRIGQMEPAFQAMIGPAIDEGVPGMAPPPAPEQAVPPPDATPPAGNDTAPAEPVLSGQNEQSIVQPEAAPIVQPPVPDGQEQAPASPLTEAGRLWMQQMQERARAAAQPQPAPQPPTASEPARQQESPIPGASEAQIAKRAKDIAEGLSFGDTARAEAAIVSLGKLAATGPAGTPANTPTPEQIMRFVQETTARQNFHDRLGAAMTDLYSRNADLFGAEYVGPGILVRAQNAMAQDLISLGYDPDAVRSTMLKQPGLIGQTHIEHYRAGRLQRSVWDHTTAALSHARQHMRAPMGAGAQAIQARQQAKAQMPVVPVANQAVAPPPAAPRQQSPSDYVRAEQEYRQGVA